MSNFQASRLHPSARSPETRLKSLIEKEAVYSPLGVWAVELKDTAEFVGWFMLIKTGFEVPELGFMIVRSHWGRGFAVEVAQALIDFGMKELSYPGIAAVTDHENAASIHILEKLGFRRVNSRTKLDKVLGREVEADIFELR